VNTRYDTDLDEPGLQDREISLGTTTILGIFFALALLCAVFFGFGYTMGRRSAQPVASPAAEAPVRSENSTSKPSPGSPASQAISTADKQADDTTQSAVVPLDSATPAKQESLQPVSTVKAAAPTPRSIELADTASRPSSKPAGIVPVAAALPTPGSSVVQVAAMSHQEDADVVATDLKRRGYTVAIRREPQDKLFHVQIGPFPTKKEADGMRQRLQADGYNSVIVK
jgi:cell division septation protein DedD